MNDWGGIVEELAYIVDDVTWEKEKKQSHHGHPYGQP